MAEEVKGQVTPAAGSGSEGGKKKIAGKFDTLEQAVEEGYTGLEKLVLGQGEKIAALTKVLEAALTADPGAPPREDDRRGGDYNRRPADDNQINPADFIANPSAELDRRDERLLKGVVRIVTDAMAGREAVDQFKRENPGLVKHEKLVKAFMRETNPRDSIEDRLKAAGKEAEKYLADMKAEFAGKKGKAPEGDDFVESPRGPVSRAPFSNVPAEEDEEKELAEYIRERQ